MDILQTIDELRSELVQTVRAGSSDEIPWSWVAKATSQILHDHSTGVSRTVLLTELESQWHGSSTSNLHPGVVRTVGPFFHNAGTAPPPASTVFGLRITGTRKLENTDFWIWQVCGAPEPENTGATGVKELKKRNTVDKHMDFFVHQRYYPMLSAFEFEGFFNNSRTMLATGLATADRGGAKQPIRTLLPTTSLAFVLRLKDDPTLAKSLRRHTDEYLLCTVFGVEYTGDRFRTHGAPAFPADQIWCKVETIHAPQMRMKEGRSVLVQEVECFYEHVPGCPLVVLEFWDADMPLVRLFNSGDHLGLLCPLVLARDADVATRAVYGANTIAFCMKAINRHPNTTITQTRVARNDLGFFDYRGYAPRVLLSDLRSDIMHLDLVAHVAQVSGNLPFGPPDDAEDRYVVKLWNPLASVERDVTLWGALGRQCARLRPGHLVLLVSLETTEEHGELKINGSPEIDSAALNLSTLPALLTSPGLRTYTKLDLLPSHGSRFISARAMQVSAAPQGLCDARDRMQATALVHDACGWPVVCATMSSAVGAVQGPADALLFDCHRCCREKLPSGEVVSAFSVHVLVDDGTAVRKAQMDTLAAARLLGLTPRQFLELPSESEQAAALKRAAGGEIVAAVSLYVDPCDQTQAMRIDVLCPAEDVGTTDDI